MKSQTAFLTPAFQADREPDFFPGVDAFIEPAHGFERIAAAEDEGAGRQLAVLGEPGPEDDQPSGESGERGFSTDERPSPAHFTSLQGSDGLTQGFRCDEGIGIEKDQVLSTGAGGSGIAGAGELVDRLEDDFRPGFPGDSGGAIGGIVVGNDQVRFEPGGLERSAEMGGASGEAPPR